MSTVREEMAYDLLTACLSHFTFGTAPIALGVTAYNQLINGAPIGLLTGTFTNILNEMSAIPAPRIHRRDLVMDDITKDTRLDADVLSVRQDLA